MRLSHPHPFTAALGWVAISSFLAGSLLFVASSSSRPIPIPDLHNTGVDNENVAFSAWA